MTPFALALLVLAPLLQGDAPTEDGAPCTPGLWRVRSRTPGPGGVMRTSPATSTVRCFLDGHVELAEYRDLGPDGSVLFRGVSLHAWERDGTERTTLWLMLGDPGHTLLAERMQDGALLSEGMGRDRGGNFLETSVTTFDDAGGYRFEMERSFDEGATWRRPFNVIDATYAGEAPAAPEALTPATQDAKRAAGATGTGIPVLDGLAELELLTREEAGHVRRIVRFSARYARPDRWRTVEWEVGSLEVTQTSLPIPAPESAGAGAR